MKNYKELKVWQKAFDLAIEVYNTTNKFPQHELYGLTSQMRKAIISVVSNIAEGHTRKHTKEFIQMLHIALSSLAEFETQLLISKELKYLNDEKFNNCCMRIVEIQKMIRGLITKLTKKI